MRARPLVVVMSIAACSRAAPPPAGDAIRFLHTYDTRETELFNQLVEARAPLGARRIESSLVPFARGQQVIAAILHTGTCPDLIRIDATWLPPLVDAQLVRPVPQGLVALDWTPEAAELAQYPAGTWHAVPQSVDGLVVVRDRDTPAPARADVGALVAAARAAKSDRAPYPLGVRVDGYWAVPWLRAAGGDLRVDAPDAARVAAIEQFAGLFGDVAAPPPPGGRESVDELRRWRARGMAYWMTGPWQLGALAEPERAHLAIDPIARAPRGGQLLVVPQCAPHPDDGWKLAGALVDVDVEIRFAAAFATVPTRRAAFAAPELPAIVRATSAALAAAEPLPRAAITPLLFDDLNPALAAVAARDATPAEAMAGVVRGWARLSKAAAHAGDPAPAPTLHYHQPPGEPLLRHDLEPAGGPP